MPKRSAQEKIVHYKRKLRRLEEKEKKRRDVRRLSDSSDDEYYTDNIMDEIRPAPAEIDSEPDIIERPPVTEASPLPLSEEAQLPPITMDASMPPEVNPPPPDATTVSTDEAPEPTIAPELLMALGTSSSDTPDFGEPILESLAKLWPPLLSKGLPKEEKSTLLKEYLIPSNCKWLQAPKLNAEISAATSETVRHRDKKLANFQRDLGVGITAINRGMDVILKCQDKVKALKSLSDGCRLLTDLHYSFSYDRKKLITPSIDKSFLHMIQDTERDETLFGTTLADKIKASKAIEKQGSQIKKATNQKAMASTSHSSATRTTHLGNWTGPPRYPSFRGGRGGQRKPAATSRRPYPVTMASTNPTPSKNFSQSKFRAHTQH